MSLAERTLQPGDSAPDVTLPAVNRDTVIRLDDYRDRTAVLVGLFRGIYCAFCRRHVASMARIAEPLRALGVETLAVVATPADKSRLYYRYHPVDCLIAADPELTSHRAFGVPQKPISEEIGRIVVALGDELARQEGLDAPPGRGLEFLDRGDGIDQAEHKYAERHEAQFTAQFLIDRRGVIRWSNVECEKEGLAGLEGMPSPEEFLAAARSLGAAG